MLKNYLKIAWRNLLKDRQFTILNLVGLATGLACTLLIYLWVTDELNVDKFHENDNRLFQVMAKTPEAGGIATGEQTTGLLASSLAAEMPEVEHAVATQGSFSGKYTLSAGDKYLKAVGMYAGKDYFDVFSFPLLAGDKSQVLSDKSSIVLSKEMALRLFNTTENIVGKKVEWERGKQFVVSGVFEGTPPNSSVQFDFLMPYESFLDAFPNEKDWNNSDPSTYLLLKKGTDVNGFNRKIEGFMKSKNKISNTKLFIRPFSSGYLHGRYENGIQSGGRIEYVRLFAVIALFILVIACINFMNLATAKASKRMKEVGIKKVVGATRLTLVIQYLGESLLMAFFSLLFAIVLVAISLSTFNEITGKQLTLGMGVHVILPFLGITFFAGLLAGSYPALYLSGFKPVAILKGKFRNSMTELWVRRGLVVFQFTLSVVFIIAVLAVYRQIEFIQTKDRGFNKDNVISFSAEGMVAPGNMTPEDTKTFLTGVETFLGDVKNMPGVVNASSIDHNSLVGDYGNTGDINWEGKDPHMNLSFNNIGVNYGFIETLGMTMAAGRSFSRALSSDSSEIIFNESAIKAMGLKNPIGKTVKMWGQDRRVVGVVKDFHYESLHENVRPFALRLEPLLTYRFMARIKSGNENDVIARIGALYQKKYPGFNFDYSFLDQDYQAQYVAEKRVAILSRYFSGLTILIACLGLFGLAAFTAERRFKEIGIRKVLGATVGNVVVMLSADFLKLIFVAVLISFPLAWWATSRWLDTFAYRIDLGAGIFLAAGAATLLITLLTISYQAIKTAIANPVTALRSE
jgi:putative ABC transport system permease protein